MKNRADAARVRALLEKELETARGNRESAGTSLQQRTGKEHLRSMHRSLRLSRSTEEIAIVEGQGEALLREFAEGREVSPENFDPVLVEVQSETWESSLFRFATLLWSVPVSRGYGRRMRYLVRDGHNGKLVGILALGDPVFNLRARDEHIGWNAADRKERLYHVMDAYVLGAVPPYNRLLAGKLIALCTLTDEIRSRFRKKYAGCKTVIEGKQKSPALVLVTTTSALGRSSVYNRLRLPDDAEPAFQSVGYSSGWGHFQVGEETFAELRRWLRKQGETYADAHAYGSGPSWRFRTIRKAASLLGIDDDVLHHGVQREVFLGPHATNYIQYLKGEQVRPRYLHRSMKDVAQAFVERWMLPRSERIDDWRAWTRENTFEMIASNFRQP